MVAIIVQISDLRFEIAASLVPGWEPGGMDAHKLTPRQASFFARFYVLQAQVKEQCVELLLFAR